MIEEPPFAVPGGWELRQLRLNATQLVYWAPAEPDAFLDDPASVAAHGPTLEDPARDDIPLWQYVWPSAAAMASLIYRHRWSSQGREPVRGLELGAGVGVVGLAALAAGLHVTFSDYQEQALQVAQCNARLNGFHDFETQALDWTKPGPDQYPFVFGCDVIYEPAIHKPILNVLDLMLENGGEAWLGDPGRSHLPGFMASAKGRGYSVEIRDVAGQNVTEPQFGAFQLLILTRSGPQPRR